MLDSNEYIASSKVTAPEPPAGRLRDRMKARLVALSEARGSVPLMRTDELDACEAEALAWMRSEILRSRSNLERYYCRHTISPAMRELGKIRLETYDAILDLLTRTVGQ